MSITPLMPVYPRCGFRPVRGEGCYLIGEDGRRALDFAAGIAVNALGHGHPHLTKAICEQTATLMHVSNLYGSPQGEALAQRIGDNSFAGTVFCNNSGVEAVIALAGIVGHVTLFEFDSKLRADAVLQRKLASLPNVTIVTSALTTEVTGDGNKVNGLVYKDRNTDQVKRIDLAGVFVQIGLLPNTDWLKGTINLSKFGEIEIDAKGQTSVAGVFAAGDCTTVPYKQIVIAMGAGATASLSAFDHLIRTSAPA